MIVVGKLNFVNEFEAIKGNEGNVLDPILVRIRDDCNYRRGLCAFSDNIFPVHINNINNLQFAKVNNVNICRGHSYLLNRTLLISSDKNLIESFKQNKIVPDKTYKVSIDEEINPSYCPDSNLTPPSPILFFGNPKKTSQLPISINKFSTYYAIDSGD